MGVRGKEKISVKLAKTLVLFPSRVIPTCFHANPKAMSQIPELGYSGKCVALVSVANSILAANSNEETKMLHEIEFRDMLSAG